MPRTAYVLSWQDRSWMDEAACAGMSTALFYAETSTGRAEAKAVCGRCPVIDACLWSCLVEEEEHTWLRFGVRGGLEPAERHKIDSALGRGGAARRLTEALRALTERIPA